MTDDFSFRGKGKKVRRKPDRCRARILGDVAASGGGSPGLGKSGVDGNRRTKRYV